MTSIQETYSFDLMLSLIVLLGLLDWTSKEFVSTDSCWVSSLCFQSCSCHSFSSLIAAIGSYQFLLRLRNCLCSYSYFCSYFDSFWTLYFGNSGSFIMSTPFELFFFGMTMIGDSPNIGSGITWIGEVSNMGLKLDF